MTTKILKQEFFQASALSVAPKLLGKYLVREYGGNQHASKIIDVEAYVGVQDRAAHARHGETPRNSAMFGPPGVWYVYFIYGMYDMLNIVCSDVDVPHAILIRGTDSVAGPGRLTRELKIDRKLNTKIAQRESGLWIEDRGVHVSKQAILRLPRVGISFAGEIWAKKPYRFVYQPE